MYEKGGWSADMLDVFQQKSALVARPGFPIVYSELLTGHVGNSKFIDFLCLWVGLCFYKWAPKVSIPR